VQTIESAVISPKLIGERVGMHPAVVIFIILLSERLFGVIGMFFAVPLFSIALVIFNRVINSIVKSSEI
jgi:predicted PurR-regulated permease PerM